MCFASLPWLVCGLKSRHFLFKLTCFMARSIFDFNLRKLAIRLGIHGIECIWKRNEVSDNSIWVYWIMAYCTPRWLYNITQPDTKISFNLIAYSRSISSIPTYPCTFFYQLPLTCTSLMHVAWKTLSISRHVPMTLHFLNDVAYDTNQQGITTKI